jgi:hypothetical protein
MLGCMCAAAAPGLLAGRDKQQQVLELFSIALGPTAAEAVTNAAAAAGGCRRMSRGLGCVKPMLAAGLLTLGP